MDRNRCHTAAGSGLALAFALWTASALAADFYVAPDGDDANAGTLERPFRSIERGERAAAAGDTVYLRGGVYRFSGTQASVGAAFTKSGSSGKPIRYFAYQDEQPIFDLFELKPQARVTGLDVRADWIHLRGLEVRGVRQLIVGDSWGVRLRGSHNVVERLNVHDCEAPGIFIASGASNLILNCDSHHNYDPLEQGGNADGFGCHSTGGDNVLRGCRAYENSDDGFDLINAPGTCIVEGSWAFRNGYIPNTNMTGAQGAGFKSGGYGEPPKPPAGGVPRHVIRGNVAFGNRVIGFYANYHPGGLDFFNNTAFDNPNNFDMRPSSLGATSHKLRNNLAAGTGRAIVSLMGGSDESNSWTLPVMATSADFVSMDKAMGTAPRRADGSLPEGLMRLVAGSDLIDRGVDLGLPFIGRAPDLGAYEFGIATGSDGGSGVDAGAVSGTDAGTGAPPTDAGADAAPPRPDAGAGGVSADASASTPPGTRDGSVPATATQDGAVIADAATGPQGSGARPTPPQGEEDEPRDADEGCALSAPRAGAAKPLLLLGAFALSLLRRRRARAQQTRKR